MSHSPGKPAPLSDEQPSKQIQSFRDRGYRILLVCGESGSGKSTFCKLYTNAADEVFTIGHDGDDGTIFTVLYPDEDRRIVWIDTRGLSHDLPFMEWVTGLSLLGPVNGIVFMVRPQKRASNNPFLKDLGALFERLKSESAYFMSMCPAECFSCAEIYKKYTNIAPFYERIDEFLLEWIGSIPSASFRCYSVEGLLARIESLENSNRCSADLINALQCKLETAEKCHEDVTSSLHTEFEQVIGGIQQQHQSAVADLNEQINTLKIRLAESEQGKSAVADELRYRLHFMNRDSREREQLLSLLFLSWEEMSETFFVLKKGREQTDELTPKDYVHGANDGRYAILGLLPGAGSVFNGQFLSFGKQLREKLFELNKIIRRLEHLDNSYWSARINNSRARNAKASSSSSGLTLDLPQQISNITYSGKTSKASSILDSIGSTINTSNFDELTVASVITDSQHRLRVDVIGSNRTTPTPTEPTVNTAAPEIMDNLTFLRGVFERTGDSVAAVRIILEILRRTENLRVGDLLSDDILSAFNAVVSVHEGAIINQRHPASGNTLLHTMSRLNQVTAVRSLLSNPSVDVDATNSHGDTPLLFALNWYQNIDIVNALVNRGASVSHLNSFGLSALNYAANYLNPQLWSELVIARDDPCIPIGVFQSAILSGRNIVDIDAFLCSVLTPHNCDIDETNEEGQTLLDLLGRHRLHHSLFHSIQLGATSSQVLLTASYYGLVDLTRFLLNQGVSPDAMNDECNTAVHLAVTGPTDPNDRMRVINDLLKGGASVNARNDLGATPLMLAACLGLVDVCRALMEVGAEVNDDNGIESVIFVAAEFGNSELVSLLLEHNAKVNIIGGYNRTPLWIASSEGHEEVVRLLLRAGADSSFADEEGVTPLMAAKANSHTNVCEILTSVVN